MVTLFLVLIVGGVVGAMIGLSVGGGYDEENEWTGAVIGGLVGGLVGALIALGIGSPVSHYEMKPVALIKIIPFKLQDDSVTVYQGIKVNDRYYRFYIQESTGYKYLKALNLDDYLTYTDKDVNDTRIVYYESSGLKQQYKRWAFTLHKKYRVLYLSMKNGEPKLMEENLNIN